MLVSVEAPLSLLSAYNVSREEHTLKCCWVWKSNSSHFRLKKQQQLVWNLRHLLSSDLLAIFPLPLTSPPPRTRAAVLTAANCFNCLRCNTSGLEHVLKLLDLAWLPLLRRFVSHSLQPEYDSPSQRKNGNKPELLCSLSFIFFTKQWTYPCLASTATREPELGPWRS